MNPPNEIDLHVGAALMRARKRLGMTRADLAAAMGVEMAHLADCELGRVRLGPVLLISAAAVLGIAASDLLRAAGAPDQARLLTIEGAQALLAAYASGQASQGRVTITPPAKPGDDAGKREPWG